ncbi:hypothetical protein GOP47_0026889 [Adiantum capillus-veneris]|nr:hypothetical protein GOP47_0026889 [Adiantum capillus-veneris]
MAMNIEDLERLAVFHKSHPKDATKSNPLGLVESDILIKIYKEDAGHKVYTSPMTVKTSRLLVNRPSTFMYVVLGESCRRMDLCASAGEYKHPESPCRTSSIKLLKKLVQIEKGIVATLYYYNGSNTWH